MNKMLLMMMSLNNILIYFLVPVLYIYLVPVVLSWWSDINHYKINIQQKYFTSWDCNWAKLSTRLN